MQALALLEGARPAQVADRLRPASIVVASALCRLDGPPDALNHAVIQRPPAPLHPAVHPARFEPGRQRQTGEGRSRSSRAHLRLGVPTCPVQGADAAVAVEGARDCPRHHIARTPLADRHHGDQPVAPPHVGHGRPPDLGDAPQGDAAPQVGGALRRGDQGPRGRRVIDGLPAHPPPLNALVMQPRARGP